MSQNRTGGSRFVRASFGLSAILLVTALVPTLHHKPEAVSARKPRGGSMPNGRVANGTELIAVFIASSTCGASQNPRLPAALAQIRSNFAAQASKEGKRFIYAGVAVDEQPATGLNFLKRFGPFDEVLSGGSWLGTGSVDFMVRGMPGPLSLPQIVILERDVKTAHNAISISSDRIVRRALGFGEIFRLAGMSDSGTVVPVHTSE